ncbi:hypothetical protein OHC33_002269 [Knufia fluminis]|uniref:Dienelactone hydrolase domain-containing protein n=1 Tax=Knufia fluminis TaxID=191047 RepID=A0AAN8IAI5_9EURO|nr:hypothetical protein OHC33_002269 [Knufia fluminis]
MADPELATRAPESDLQEDLEEESLADDKQPLTRNPAQSTSEPEPESQPTLSDHCITSRPLPPNLISAPSGTISKWPLDLHGTSNNTEVYVSKPSDYPSTPARLLLLLTNGTGIHSPNNQHQADMFARAGYLAVMPDLFLGDPAPNSKPEENAPDPNASWLDTVKLKAAETAKSFMLDMWLARHTPEKVLPIIRGVLQQAREEFADAVAHGDGVYAVGYCFGGRYVLTLAGERADNVLAGREAQGKAEEGQVPRGMEIKAGVCAHGTLVGREDVRDVKSPVQLVCVEDDPLFPADVLEEGRKHMNENAVDYEVEVYKGVPHGFAVVGEYESQGIMDAQAKAFDGMIRWLNAH